MKYLLYAIWFTVICLGAFLNSFIPETFKYIFGFTIGAFSQGILVLADYLKNK